MLVVIIYCIIEVCSCYSGSIFIQYFFFEGIFLMFYFFCFVVLFGGFVFGCVNLVQVWDVDVVSYGYLLINLFEVIIVIMLLELCFEFLYSEDIDQKDYSLKLCLECEFVLLDNFWLVKKLCYCLVCQDYVVLLIFIIVGIGVYYVSSFLEYLKKFFYQVGYYVVQLFLLISWDFMVSVLCFVILGFFSDDVDDLYWVMQVVCVQQCDLLVIDYYFIGYSLGVLNVVFVSYFDESCWSFNFKKVLLFNLLVNFYILVSNFDKLVEIQVKGIIDLCIFYEVVLSKLICYFWQKGYVDINDVMFYDFQQLK